MISTDKALRIGMMYMTVVIAVIVIFAIAFMSRDVEAECSAVAEPSGCAKGLFCSEAQGQCLSKEQCVLSGETAFSNDACFAGI